MAQLNQYKVNAFTIMESMVSIVIVMIVFSLSSVVIMNISSSGMTREKQNAYMLVKSVKNKAIQQSRYLDETIELDGFTIEKTILDYSRGDELKVLLVEAFKNNRKVFESKELIILKRNK